MTKHKNTKIGYKQSKLGLIPEEWEVVTLEDIGKVKMCKRVFNKETLQEGDIPFYKIGTFGKKADAYISKTLYNTYRTRFSFPKKGEILMSASGTLGRTVVYDGIPAYFQDSNIVWISHDESKILNKFLLYVYKIIRYESEGGTIKRLYNSIIYNAKLRLPPLPQQQKIAQILSTWDSAIAKQNQLIQAKQKQKKALMQLLLTGNKRFKGFTEEWRFFKLKDLLKYLQPTPYIVKSTEYKDEYKTPVLTAGKTFLLGHTNETDGVFIKNLPVIIFDDFTTAKKYVNFPFKVKSSAMKILISNCDIDIRLIFEFMQQIKFVHEDHKRYWISEFQELEIKMPTTLKEQQKIVQVLSKADQEIELLAKQLSQLEKQKQGLMQVLLTGKVLVTV